MIKELLMKWNKTSVLECNSPWNSYGEKENLQWININLNAIENIKQTKKMRFKSQNFGKNCWLLKESLFAYRRAPSAVENIGCKNDLIFNRSSGRC